VSKTILIAPFEGPLAAAIADEAGGAGWTVGFGRAQRRGAAAGAGSAPGGEVPGEGPSGAVAIAYEPRSFVSASTLVISAENALGPLDAAVIVFDPSGAKAELLDAKPGELAALVEERCSGPLFLAREIVRRFEARGAGRLLLVAPESPRDAAQGPAAAMAEKAFEGLGSGLFAAASSSAWSAYGIRDASGQADRLARFALELLSEPKPSKAGRWLRYSGKAGLFGQ
jgi:hypothetical protein